MKLRLIAIIAVAAASATQTAVAYSPLPAPFAKSGYLVRTNHQLGPQGSQRLKVRPRVGKEDCVGFSNRNAQPRRINGRWKVVDGNHRIADFGGKRREAFQAFGIIKRYRMSKQCFVGRPGPSMTYWLR